MDDWQVKLMAKLCLLVALMLTLDVAAITTDPRKTTLVATVITPKSSIRI
jgi:nitric oxide reductase large subunit